MQHRVTNGPLRRLTYPSDSVAMPPPPRILIVEDEQVLAENLKAYLDRHVPDVRIVPDSERAIEMLKTFTPDAILVEHELPGKNGLDTYSEMMDGQRNKIDCVMISSGSTEDLDQNASDRGIRSVLPKPFSFTELMVLAAE